MLKDSKQGFYWENNQAVLYPFIVLIKDQHL
jgi:hypothetical protein